MSARPFRGHPLSDRWSNARHPAPPRSVPSSYLADNHSVCGTARARNRGRGDGAGCHCMARTGSFQRAQTWVEGRTNGEVAERSNATDCKSVALAASEVRILPSPPAFAHCRWTEHSRRGLRLAGRHLRAGWRQGKPAGLPPSCAEGGERRSREGGSNSVVESQPSKLLVAGSIPVSRSSLRSPIERQTDRRRATSVGW
jgi:hypothetical protein